MIRNKDGLALSKMLICMGVLFIAFLFAVFFMNQLIKGFGDGFQSSLSNGNTYTSVEESVSAAAYSYYEKYYKEEIGLGTITISTENLIKYGVLREVNLIVEEDKCGGYALIRRDEENNIVATSYLHCSFYETNNYQSWRLGE